MPPSRLKPNAERLVKRFRSVCRKHDITRSEGFKIMNQHFLSMEPMKMPTFDKLRYGPPGKNVSAETAIALQKFVDYFSANETKTTKQNGTRN